MSKSEVTLAYLLAKAHLIWRGQRDIKETLQRFRTCVALLGPTTPLVSIRTRHLDDLKEAIWALPGLRGVRSQQTINRYLATISKALHWAARRDLIPSVPYIPREPGESFRLVYFTEGEEAEILRYFMRRGNGHVATLVRVLSLTGLRASELLALTAEDVEMGSIHVRRSKNGKDRFVPLEAPLDQALKEAIRAGLPSYVGLNKYLNRARKSCLINKGKTLHVFRHTCATRLTRLGIPTAVVKDFLGHKSMNTTMKYAHVEDAALRAAARLLERSSGLTDILSLPASIGDAKSLLSAL